MLTLRLRRGGERLSGEGEADGFECGDGAAAGGFDDRSDVGIKAAPHSVRKLILRKVTRGRSARSEPLFVAGMAWLVTKTNMWRRIFLITRWSLTPAFMLAIWQ